MKTRRNADSVLDMMPSAANTSGIITVRSSKGYSFFCRFLLTITGVSSAVTPRISEMLQMFEPQELPRASAGLPSRAEKTDTSISGAEVPKPIIRIPMRISGTPRHSASPEAPSTNFWALYIRTAKPITTHSSATTIL